MKGYKKNRLSRYVLAALTVGMFSMVPVAYALPVAITDGSYKNVGGANINTDVAKTMGISSNSSNNVINWKTFSIAKGETVGFDAKNYLNLVRGASKSEIDGVLNGEAGGTVYLINPNGILFGSTAQVNVGNLVASTRAITDEDQQAFLNGNNPITTNTAGSAAGDIINLGKLQTTSLVLEGNNITIQNAADITSNGTTPLTSAVTIKAAGNITVGHEVATTTRSFTINGTATDKTVHDYKNATVASSEYTGKKLDGTTDNAIKEAMLVDNVYDLQNMDANLSGNYMLAGDIDASETSTWNDGAGFSPVGYITSDEEHPFTGTFDGATHTISKLNIKRASTNYVGLFGYTATGSILQNVGMIGGSITGHFAVGSVAGRADGTITNVYNTGMVSGNNSVGGVVGYANGSTITNAYNTGTVSGNIESVNVGGVVGSAYCTINNVYNTGAVSGESDVGGVVGGLSGGTLSYAYNTGAVSASSDHRVSSYTGGVAGYNSGTITNVYNIGTVSAPYNFVGGVAGENARIGTITNAYNTGAVSGGSDVGGVVGKNSGSTNNTWYATTNAAGNTINQTNDSGAGTAKTLADMKKAATYSSLTGADAVSAVGNGGTTWRIYEGYTTPLLTSFFKGVATVSTATSAAVEYNGQEQKVDVSKLSFDPASIDTSHIHSDGGVGTKIGSYDFNLYSDQQGYDLVDSGNQTFTITRKTLTATLTGTNVFTKGYDGTTTLTQNLGSHYTLSGLVGSEQADIASSATVSGSYADKKAEDNKTITFTGITLTGDDAGNYTIASTLSGNVGRITKKDLTVVLIEDNKITKVYDGTTAVTASLAKDKNYSLPDLVSGDVVTLTASGTYDNKNEGEGKQVSFTGLGLTGDDAGNYNLTTEALSGNVGKITKKSLVSEMNNGASFTKVYDGTTAVNTALVLDSNYAFAEGDVVTGDAVSLDAAKAVGTYDSKDVGSNKQVNFTNLTLTGTDAGNYELLDMEMGINGASITPKALTATVTGDNVFTKVYDGTTAVSQALGTNYALDGIVSDSDKVLLSAGSGAYNDKNAGDNKTITFSGLALTGEGAGNYTIASTLSGAVGQITRKTITGTLASGYSFDKVYDGTTTASLGNGYTLSGVVAGDKVPLTAAKGFYDSSAVGNRTVTFSGFSINDGNYLLSMADSLSGTGKITSGSQDHNYNDALVGFGSFFDTDPANGMTIFRSNPEDYVPRAVSQNNGQSYKAGVTQVTQTWYNGPISITIINGGITLPKNIFLGSAPDTKIVVLKGGTGYEI